MTEMTKETTTIRGEIRPGGPTTDGPDDIFPSIGIWVSDNADTIHLIQLEDGKEATITMTPTMAKRVIEYLQKQLLVVT